MSFTESSRHWLRLSTKPRRILYGIIDKNGKLLKKPKTREEKDAYNYFDRFIFNLKRILHKFGMKSKLSNYASALFLLKEYNNMENYSEDEIHRGIINEMAELKENKTLREFLEENAPTNATGAAVTGTGDDRMHWVKQQNRKRYGKPIDGAAFLRRKRYEEKKRFKERFGNESD